MRIYHGRSLARMTKKRKLILRKLVLYPVSFYCLQWGLVSPSLVSLSYWEKVSPFCRQHWFCLSSCPHFTTSLKLFYVQIYSYHHWPGNWHCQTLPCDLMSNKSLTNEQAVMNLVQITLFLIRYLSDF